MDSNLSKCEQLESYLFTLYRQINDCYLEMPHVINGGRYWVSLRMKLCELEKELGSMVYIKEHWIEYHKYEEKLRMQVALGCLMWSTSAFYEYYETHNEELDSAYSQKDLIEQYMEAKDSVYGGYQASFGEVITPGYYKRIAAKCSPPCSRILKSLKIWVWLAMRIGAYYKLGNLRGTLSKKTALECPKRHVWK